MSADGNSESFHFFVISLFSPRYVYVEIGPLHKLKVAYSGVYLINIAPKTKIKEKCTSDEPNKAER